MGWCRYRGVSFNIEWRQYLDLLLEVRWGLDPLALQIVQEKVACRTCSLAELLELNGSCGWTLVYCDGWVIVLAIRRVWNLVVRYGFRSPSLSLPCATSEIYVIRMKAVDADAAKGGRSEAIAKLVFSLTCCELISQPKVQFQLHGYSILCQALATPGLVLSHFSAQRICENYRRASDICTGVEYPSPFVLLVSAPLFNDQILCHTSSNTKHSGKIRCHGPNFIQTVHPQGTISTYKDVDWYQALVGYLLVQVRRRRTSLRELEWVLLCSHTGCKNRYGYRPPPVFKTRNQSWLIKFLTMEPRTRSSIPKPHDMKRDPGEYRGRLYIHLTVLSNIDLVS